MRMRVDASQMFAAAASIEAAERAVKPKIRLAVQKTVTDIQSTAQRMAPVDTGFLRSSITSRVTGSGWTVQGEVGPSASYGIYVEMGTSRMAPQPYMRPAAERHLPALNQAIDGLLSGILP